MNTAEFNELGETDKRHFYKCQQCGEKVDKQQLDGCVASQSGGRVVSG
jgi:hypothetical protein